RSSGAHFLSIPGGHSIDALTSLVGPFASLSAIVRTARNTVDIIGTGETLPRTSADQVVVMGELENGVTATLRLSGASSFGTGVRIEVNGDAGDLVIEAAPGGRGIQMTDLTLHRTVAMGVLEAVPVPESAYAVPDTLRACPPMNVGEAYLHMADAIAGKRKANPDFGDAVKMHELLDLIELSAREGRRVTV
ncbi:MAG: hypothetical protein JWL66_2277, partial [Sphingomonadales bacterium]|nr:hypothetical protein [Sphingomonadales bacterium]